MCAWLDAVLPNQMKFIFIFIFGNGFPQLLFTIVHLWPNVFLVLLHLPFDFYPVSCIAAIYGLFSGVSLFRLLIIFWASYLWVY